MGVARSMGLENPSPQNAEFTEIFMAFSLWDFLKIKLRVRLCLGGLVVKFSPFGVNSVHDNSVVDSPGKPTGLAALSLWLSLLRVI